MLGESGDTTIRVSRKTRRDLMLLREAWGLPNIDAVLQRVLAQHRPELVKAIGIAVAPEEEHQP